MHLSNFLKFEFVFFLLFSIVIIRLIVIDWQKRKDIDLKSLAFKTYGKAGQRILLLHGILGSHRYWSSVADRLAVNHFLVAPDLLGFGESPKPYLKYTVQDHLEPCNVRSGNEKGRVENGVGYVKKNFLAGLELPDFAALQCNSFFLTLSIKIIK